MGSMGTGCKVNVLGKFNHSNSEKISLFLYLNLYVFLLLGLGIIIIFIPINILLVILKCFIILWCIIGAFTILAKYKIKVRQLTLLVKRNSKIIRPDTFKAHLKTPCGMLLVDKVLNELRKSEIYKNLNKTEWDRIKRTVYRKTPKKILKSKKEV